MFTLDSLQREPSKIQPLEVSRFRQNNRRKPKSTEAEALANALLDVVSIGRDLCGPNQVRDSLDSKHDSEMNLGDNHPNTKLEERKSSQKAFADDKTIKSLVVPIPFQPTNRAFDIEYSNQKNTTQKPPKTLPQLTPLSRGVPTTQTTIMGHPNYENHALARRQRPSATIAIKRTALNPQSKADQLALANAVREHEWATWRLYDRIMSHRQRHQELYDRLAEKHELFSDENLGIKDHDTASETTLGESSTMDEGIFEMDL